MNWRLPSEKTARILRVLANERDLTSAELAERFAVNAATIETLRRKHNLPRVPVFLEQRRRGKR